MARPVTYDEALITSVIPYGESDCIVRMLTRGSGRVSAFFRRGLAARSGSNAPQAPALATVGLIYSSQKLTRLVSCDLRPSLFTNSLKVFGYSVYIAEVVEKLLPEEDWALEVFHMVEAAYAELAHSGASSCLLRAFELQLLDYCGYLPEMPTAQEEETIVAFDPLSCRFITEENDNSLAFSPDAIKLAKSMLIAKIGSVNYEEDYELLMIGRIFQSRLKLMGLFPLKSVAFLKQLSGR